MKNKKTKIYFWVSIIIWIVSAWVLFFNAVVDTIQKLGVNLSTDLIREIAIILLVISNLYIIWAFVEKRKFPPY